MNPRFMTMLTVAGVLALLGAACAKKSVNVNTNSSSAGNTNVTVVNTNRNGNTNTQVIDLTNTPSTSVPKGAEVSITAREFSPQTVTIKVGGTVTWTNNDSVVHQPASDPHPTHTNLPGFDALGGVQTGKTFQFTFTRAGTFTYHDHPFTSRTGKVVVEQ